MHMVPKRASKTSKGQKSNSDYMDNLMQVINEFLVQAHKGDLKTSLYPREWSGLKMKVSFGMGAPARMRAREGFDEAITQVF